EMLTGQVPFTGVNAIHVITKHLNETPTPPHELEPSIPPRVEALVLRAIAKEKKDRFASMAEIEAELRGVFAELVQLPGWELAPLDPADLELILRADGRLVQPVTRRGKPALRQIHRDENGVETDEPGWSLTIFIARLNPNISSQLGVLR
ncbi:MAG: hypothetical protein KC431_27045, partial [Myxococcales bacterium]|nr:hypothetical protein [Myxococcales bacterium]